MGRPAAGSAGLLADRMLGAPAGARPRHGRFRASELRCPHVEEATPEGAVCAPLAAEGESLGVLHLQLRRIVPERQRAALLADRERLIRTLAEQLELALANFRLRETLREQSARDQLTGLFNRRYMEESLVRELRRASREHYSLGLLMMDLDHFKDLNDGYGHCGRRSDVARGG